MRYRELTGLMLSAARSGTGKVLDEHGVLPERLTKAEAYRLCGRGNVDRWISEGLIGISGKTTGKCIDRERLEAAMANSNRMTYLPVAER